MPSDFTDDEARAAWREGARAFEAFVESGADYYRTLVHGPALVDACAPVGGVRALDLGCGHGFFTRELARAGARVTGVDLVGELVDYAREREAREPLGVGYRVGSAAHEPRPSDAAVRAQPKLDDCNRIPYFLIFDLVKDRAGARSPAPAAE